MAVGFAVGSATKFPYERAGKGGSVSTSNAENQGAVQEAIDSCPVSAIAWED